MYWVTKSGQVISTDDSVQMKTSSDMMAENWYQQAIHQGAMPVLTPARNQIVNGLFLSLKNLLMQRGQSWCASLGYSYETLEAYLNQLQLGQQALPLSSMKS